MLFSQWVFLVYLVQWCTARQKSTERKTQWDDIAINACAKEIESYKYDEYFKGRHASICQYEPALGSWLYCSKEVLDSRHKNQETLVKVFEKINQFCQDYYKTGPKSDNEFYEILQNASNFIRPVDGTKEAGKFPVSPDKTSLDMWVWAIFGPLDNIDKGNIYGGIICMYWLVVLLIAALYNAAGVSRLKQTVLKNYTSAFLRGHFAIPALVHNHATPVGRWFFIGLIPTRAETLILFGYVLLHGAFMSIYNVDHHELISDYKNQMLIFVSDRAGILAFAHFPLIVLFGGRNNFLHWLTGIRYKSFITFHKWLGRVMLVDCAIHAIGYTYHAFLRNYWKYVKHSPLWSFGRHGMIILGIIIFFSFFFFRCHYYEFFLVTHIILAAGFFYACWRHCYTLGWTEWITIAVIFWIVDRVVRLVKILFFGFPLAKVEMCGESLIKVTIPKTSKTWKAKPGQYIYLHFLMPSFFWQSHPFTVMDSLIDDSRLAVVITVKKGLTTRLKDYILRSENSEIRVAVEGPYGHSVSTYHFESILFLAGGSGVPGPLSMAITAARAPKSNDQSITFAWTLRDLNLLHLYKNEIEVLRDLNVTVLIYFTGETPKSISVKSAGEANPEPDGALLTASELQTVISTFGRPKIDEIIDSATAFWGSVLVVSCGSAPFVDKIREITARKVIENPGKFIEYVEDFQTW